MEISKLKCSRCRCEFIPTLKPSGESYKSCDKCREYNKEYKEENKDKRKEYFQEYNKENAEKLKEYRKSDKRKEYMKEYQKSDKRKEYKEENKDKRKEYQKKYFQNIKTTNLPLYLVYIQRKQIKRCFSKSSLNKSKHSIEYLGCDIDTFINHIQKKIDLFNEKNEIKMTFDNIHLDHIKPVSRFNLDDENEFLDCCHYTNFQPLLAKDNLEKSNKWNEENNKFWIENIKGKEYYEIYKLN
jgi:hypothetical protein